MTEAKVGRQPNLLDDQLIDCRSFGSNFHPSSQSRKISIGVMVESPANGRSRGKREQKSKVPNAEVVFSCLENSTQGNRKKKQSSTFSTTGVKSKSSEAPRQLSSPWVSTRSLKRNAPLLETPTGAQQVFHSPMTCGRQNKGHGLQLQEPPATCSVRSFANQSSMFKSGNSKGKNFDEANCQMEGVRETTNEKLHEFSFATMAEVRSDKMVIENQANKSENRTETLKMKLWEILGTVTVPNDQHSECQSHEQDVNQLITEEIVVQKHDRVVGLKHNSDTIETDSENSGQTLKRPIVRSITRKRSRVFVQSRKSKTPLGNKEKHQEGNVFVFEGVSEGTHVVATNGASSMRTRKKSGEKSFKLQPRKIFFPQKEEKKTRTFPKPTGIEELAPQEKPSFREVQGFHSSPVNHVTLEKDEGKGFNQFPQMNKTVALENIHSPADEQDGGFDNAFPNKNVDPQSHIESPTFRMKTPVCSSPSSTPKADKVVCQSSDPGSAEEILSTRNICSFRKLRTSEEDCDRSNEDDKEIEQSPLEKASIDLTKGVADYRLSDSSSEDASCESSAEDVDSSQRDIPSPEIGAIKKFKSMLRPTKRARNLENHQFDFNGPGESSWADETLVPNEEDGLARAAKLFLSELEKLKSKISSISVEKSSEVLLSVSESIHLQLQNVESQIQMDMVKLLSFGKSRRKDLETKFEEQQQQLKRINKKFQEEVNQHLQDCRNSLQELEAQQIEFKGIMEKKKVSHRNNLLQVEEEVDLQLKDAQKRIEAIHKSGRGKIVQLKQVIAMCLK